MSDEVHRITTAAEGISDAQKSRQRRYLWSMGVRTASFLGAVIAWSLGAPMWLVIVMVIAATVLPYIAVVMANAGRENDPFTVHGPNIDVRGLPGPGGAIPQQPTDFTQHPRD